MISHRFFPRNNSGPAPRLPAAAATVVDISTKLMPKPSPADDEKRFLVSSDKFADIARLVWEAPRKDPVSINVFLCRRGIFLAAFLHVTQKCVVIELFVARSTQRVRRAFRDERGIVSSRRATCAGVEDVITRPMLHHRFTFLLRLKCGVFETNEIVASMQDWASEARIHVGAMTPGGTYVDQPRPECWRARLSRDESALQKALFAIDPEVEFPPKEIQVGFANAIAAHTRLINDMPSEKRNDLARDVTAFLHAVCLYNCASDAERQKRCREDAAMRWKSTVQISGGGFQQAADQGARHTRKIQPQGYF